MLEYKLSPILLIMFNRPETTSIVFESIRKMRPPKLYIAADAPRLGNETDEEKCQLTRAVTENIDWPCNVRRLYQEQNLGCSFGPRAAFDWFFSNESEGIILEDDCVPHQDFFVFASAMLNHYRKDERIISINGSNLGYVLNNGNSYTYSRFMNMWGWATWRRSYEQIDYSLGHWRQLRNKELFLWQKLRLNLFDIDIAWIKYWRFQFDKSISEEKITWWDYQWIYNQLTHKQYAIVPAENLVTNIGFDENGHHTFFADSPAANLPLNAMPSEVLKHPNKMTPNFYFERKYIKKVWCHYHKYSVFQTIKYLVKAYFNITSNFLY